MKCNLGQCVLTNRKNENSDSSSINANYDGCRLRLPSSVLILKVFLIFQSTLVRPRDRCTNQILQML